MQIRRILATPSLIKVKCLAFEQTNTVIRQYKELINYFCRVTLVTEKHQEAHFQKQGDNSNELSDHFLKRILRDGINLFECKLIRVSHSNSSMKKKSFWFVSEEGKIKRNDIIYGLGEIDDKK